MSPPGSIRLVTSSSGQMRWDTGQGRFTASNAGQAACCCPPEDLRHPQQWEAQSRPQATSAYPSSPLAAQVQHSSKAEPTLQALETVESHRQEALRACKLHSSPSGPHQAPAAWQMTEDSFITPDLVLWGKFGGIGGTDKNGRHGGS
ncbi:hypothetical protein NDU88_005916 [Pleurodeles waltl]|uniref:Uncharacterized protein n=1 Tax=Pleurodeles waltl TaxID=8319 RepID=A0AAV7LMH0_PLEWA|nr:hypothetical protein NDU88_005916 [Pleurodeles waltl]